MSKERKIGIILLAAGTSSRMGRNKLVFKKGNETLLENTVKAAFGSSAHEVIIVFGANRKENEKLIGQFPLTIATNENWEKGIGSSIKCGLRKTTAEYPETDAVIISVCDQPYLTTDLFDKLIGEYRETGKQIVASQYAGSIGVPVLYAKSMFDELLHLPDQDGAKKHILVNTKKEAVATVPFPEGDTDIDTIQDIKNLPQL